MTEKSRRAAVPRYDDLTGRTGETRSYDRIAAFSLCTVLRDHDADPASPYRWQPKKSFHAVSAFYGRS